MDKEFKEKVDLIKKKVVDTQKAIKLIVRQAKIFSSLPILQKNNLSDSIHLVRKCVKELTFMLQDLDQYSASQGKKLTKDERSVRKLLQNRLEKELETITQELKEGTSLIDAAKESKMTSKNDDEDTHLVDFAQDDEDVKVFEFTDDEDDLSFESEIEVQTAIAAEVNLRVKKVAQEATTLQVMFDEVNRMVIEQTPVIETIEEKIAGATHDVAMGHKKVSEAADLQKDTRQKVQSLRHFAALIFLFG